jgi:hypothetical protein
MEKKPLKKLTLSKETLRDLTSRDLDQAGGGTFSHNVSCAWTHSLSCPGCICTTPSCCVC